LFEHIVFFIYKTIICQVPRKLVRTQCLYTSIQVTRYSSIIEHNISNRHIIATIDNTGS